MPSPHKGKSYYKRIGDKADEGSFSLIDPLDYLILNHLNEEGEMFAGLYPLAHTSKQITEQVMNSQIKISIVGTRMVVMGKQGLVHQVSVPGTGGTHSYQRTERGTKVLTEWQAKQETPDGDS